jgi:hypothetical protein
MTKVVKPLSAGCGLAYALISGAVCVADLSDSFSGRSRVVPTIEAAGVYGAQSICHRKDTTINFCGTCGGSSENNAILDSTSNLKAVNVQCNRDAPGCLRPMFQFGCAANPST